MSPSEYVNVYVKLPAYFDNGDVTTVSILNYLQSGLGTQSQRAQAAQNALFSAISKDNGFPHGLPASFDIDGTTVLRNALRRVFMGKGGSGRDPNGPLARVQIRPGQFVDLVDLLQQKPGRRLRW